MGLGTGTTDYLSRSTASFRDPVIIQNPDANFWTDHDAYILRVNFALSGTLDKTTESKIEFSYVACNHPGIQCFNGPGMGLCPLPA